MDENKALTQYELGESFTQLALKLPANSPVALSASILGASLATEMDRRLAEGIGLYRPWDDD